MSNDTSKPNDNPAPTGNFRPTNNLNPAESYTPVENPRPTEYVTPPIARYPNAIPSDYEGRLVGLAPHDQTPGERLAQELADELRSRNDGEPPLPIFNR